MASSASTYVISETARLNAPAQRVYETIANYRSEHARILPRQFTRLTVEHGGIGAGTVISFQVTALGRTDSYRAEVSEPEPGRVLVEKNVAGTASVTTFVVDPGTGPNESVVTIQTELNLRRGLAGAIERFIMARVLRPIYVEELRLLEAVASAPAETAASATPRA
jgi:hypothetical protein